jgi:hypothetical protein
VERPGFIGERRARDHSGGRQETGHVAGGYAARRGRRRRQRTRAPETGSVDEGGRRAKVAEEAGSGSIVPD